ncbi:MAG: hypothetical protein QME96_02295 [Myxococcota bacterium]|nr:hypothetical protein [Myxococcota bacterium]
MVVIKDGKVGTPVLQAHVIKHPFGVGAMLAATVEGRRRPWNAEGWDRLDPPTITLVERRECVTQIRGLEVAGTRCHVRRLHLEEYGGDPVSDEPCYECGGSLAAACSEVTLDVAVRYAAWVDIIVKRIASDGGVRIGALDVLRRVLRLSHRSPSKLDGLVVGSLGRETAGDSHSLRLRFNAWNGIRVEFRGAGVGWRWRTTYRRPPRAPTELAEFLLDPAPGGTLVPPWMSGGWWVPRPWWMEAEHDDAS